MNGSSVQRVVVGIDPSPHAEEALDWAAAEAERRGVPLHIVHSWSTARYAGPAGVRDDIADSLLAAANSLLEQARSRVQERCGTLMVDTELLTEEPVQGLIDTAGHNSLLVVGTRGHGRLSSTLLGSVSQRLVAHAAVPVVIVRPSPEGHQAAVGTGSTGSTAGGRQAQGSVVLGADRGEDPAVVEFAFDEAQRRGVPLRVVRSWPLPWIYPGYIVITPEDRAERDREEDDELIEVLADARKNFPDVVEVIREVQPGEPETTLVDASSGAGLVVVGAQRRRHGLALQIGPVTQRVLHHAHCPVAVVPHS